MTYTLVDPPVTPWSSHAEIMAWLDHCRSQVLAHPEDAGWQAALYEAEQIARYALEGEDHSPPA